MDVFGSTLEGERNKMIGGIVGTIKSFQEELTKIMDLIEIQDEKCLVLNKKSENIVSKINNMETVANDLIASIIRISDLDSRLTNIEKLLPLSTDKTIALGRRA